jgi:hypothetical protein
MFPLRHRVGASHVDLPKSADVPEWRPALWRLRPYSGRAHKSSGFFGNAEGSWEDRTVAEPIKSGRNPKKRLTAPEQKENISLSEELFDVSRRYPQAVHRFSRTCPPPQEKKECAMHAILPAMLFTVAALLAIVVLASSARLFSAAFAGLRQARGRAPLVEQCTITLRTVDVAWTGGGVRRGAVAQTVRTRRASALPLRAAA